MFHFKNECDSGQVNLKPIFEHYFYGPGHTVFECQSASFVCVFCTIGSSWTALGFWARFSTLNQRCAIGERTDWLFSLANESVQEIKSDESEQVLVLVSLFE